MANIDFSWCPMMPLNFPKQRIGVLTARYGDIDLTPMGPKNDKYVIAWYIKKKSRSYKAWNGLDWSQLIFTIIEKQEFGVWYLVMEMLTFPQWVGKCQV